MVVIAKEFDVVSNPLRVQHLRARYYDPSVGQFTSMDPFAGDTNDPQSLHKYAYVHGDPINGIDPSGMFLERLFDLISGRSLALFALGGPLTAEGQIFDATSIVPSVLGKNLRASDASTYINGSYTWVTIGVNSLNRPEKIDFDQVQQKVQQSLNEARLPIFVSFSNFPGDTGANNMEFTNSGLTQYPGKTVSQVWRHSITWDPTLKAGIAYTPHRTKTYINPQGVRDTAKAEEMNIPQELLYANIILHEIFYLGIGGKRDWNFGTQFATGDPRRLTTLTKLGSSDRDIVMQGLGLK
jgi:RHS repeat-associated protein